MKQVQVVNQKDSAPVIYSFRREGLELALRTQLIFAWRGEAVKHKTDGASLVRICFFEVINPAVALT